MKNMGVFAAIMGMALGSFGLLGCGAGGDDEPTISIEWISEPPGLVARNEAIPASFEVVTDDETLTVAAAGLVACSGAVPDCGLTGPDAIAFQAGATLGDDGTYTANLKIPDKGNWTVVAFASIAGDHIGAPKGVVVEKQSYPTGPYGYSVGSVVESFALQGFIDSDADDDNDPFNEEARQIKLGEFFAGEDLDAKIILVNVGAGWCPVCNQEMTYIAPKYAGYYNRGIRILNVVDQDDDSKAADLDFAKVWGARHNSTLPTAIDPYDTVLGPYFTENAVPLNVYIDATTMEIVEAYAGYDAASMNQIFDYYAP